VEFVYNNKIHTATQTLSSKANYRQDLRMGFEGRRTGRFEVAERFVDRMRKIQEETRAALEKVQEEMRKCVDRRGNKIEEYRIGDLVLLRTKDLKWQIKERRSEKLTEYFVGLFKVKKIMTTNAVELDLPTTIRIHLVVNINRIHLYKLQIEG